MPEDPITHEHHRQQPADVVTYLMGPLVSTAGQTVTFTVVSSVSISATFSIVGARGTETNKQITPDNINNSNDRIHSIEHGYWYASYRYTTTLLTFFDRLEIMLTVKPGRYYASFAPISFQNIAMTSRINNAISRMGPVICENCVVYSGLIS